MKNITMNTNEIRTANGGWTKCQICKQNVSGNWWSKYKHCLLHACRCLPWEFIFDLAFNSWQ